MKHIETINYNHLFKQSGPRRIKDRGINWKEKYHERSERLRDRYRKKLGPLSYIRWEGHDYTTDSDYFVVVSPALDKYMRKRFFAGVKKMPKDPKAKIYAPSGEYFINSQAAFSHAHEKWGVPYVKEAPHYSLNDLAGVEIHRHVKG